MAVVAMASLVGALPASANHSWGNYHWARTANPFTVKLGDNLTGDWKSQALSESAYEAKVAETERTYSDILRRLTDALRSTPAAVPTAVGAANAG